MNIVPFSFGKSSAPDQNPFNNKSWIKLKPGLNLRLDDKLNRSFKKMKIFLFSFCKRSVPGLNPFNN